MKNSTIGQLQTIIRKLTAERQHHLDAISKIEDVFKDIGITPPTGKRRGRPPKSKSAVRGKSRRRVKRGRPGRRKRGRYAVSGTQSILAFVKKAGAKGATGGDIAAQWKKEGRAGSSYNILNAMMKKGTIKRKKLKGERGSSYLAA